MHPATSVILFTVLSGMGFGMLTLLGLGVGRPEGLAAFWTYGVAYALACGGLLASSFHLGNPQRALKAFSQWRTSWLSREAWLAVATLLVFVPTALGAIFGGARPGPVLGALLALATVLATSMIYAQLRTVPRWRHWTTPALFLGFAVTGGAIVLAPALVAAGLCAGLGALLALSFRLGDAQFASSGSTIGTATGLAAIGEVRAFEPPHTGTNYLMREMIHVVARKHVEKLRVIAVLGASVLPAVLLLVLPYGVLTAGLGRSGASGRSLCRALAVLCAGRTCRGPVLWQTLGPPNRCPTRPRPRLPATRQTAGPLCARHRHPAPPRPQPSGCAHRSAAVARPMWGPRPDGPWRHRPPSPR